MWYGVYISVYKSSTKAIYETQQVKGGKSNNNKNNNQNKNKTETTRIVKKMKECMELVETFQAHTHTITRVAIGGASDMNLKQKVFATTSLKVSVKKGGRVLCVRVL